MAPAGLPAYFCAMKDDEVRQNVESTDAPGPGRTNPPQRILVVEDDGDIRRLNSEVLIQFGYHVDTAEDGAAAWDTLQLKGYDLLVTDNEMPKVTGIELLKKVQDARMTLPVIMATGKYPREGLASHAGPQPTAILFKPYTLEEFLGAVKEVLRVTTGAREQPVPPSWQSQPPADGLRIE
jgi:two-component system chemotaxis response regulator CheY